MSLRGLEIECKVAVESVLLTRFRRGRSLKWITYDNCVSELNNKRKIKKSNELRRRYRSHSALKCLFICVDYKLFCHRFKSLSLIFVYFLLFSGFQTEMENEGSSFGQTVCDSGHIRRRKEQRQRVRLAGEHKGRQKVGGGRNRIEELREQVTKT